MAWLRGTELKAVRRYVNAGRVLTMAGCGCLIYLFHYMGWGPKMIVSTLICGPCDLFTARPYASSPESSSDIAGIQLMVLASVFLAFLLAIIQISHSYSTLHLLQILLYFIAGGCLLATVLTYAPGASTGSSLNSSLLLVLLVTTASMVAAGLNFIEFSQKTDSDHPHDVKETKTSWS